MNATACKALFDEAVGAITDRVLQARGWKVHSRDFPVLDVSFIANGRGTLRPRFQCDNWNELPPAIELLNADGDFIAALPAMRTVPNGSPIFNASAHPRTGRPFICMIGAREYHTHPSHTGDAWSNYAHRSEYDLGGIVTQVWQGWRKYWP
jgi:hypothetical protein